MNQLYGVDVSEFQGRINWDELNANSNFAMIRSSFGLGRKDYQFDRNKSEAHRVQAADGPLGVGYYHYAYPQYNTPEAEAQFFIEAVRPLAAGDVLALDWEEPYSGDHVGWCLAFLQHVEVYTGVKPLLYLNQSLMRAHNWQPVIDNGNGLWVAVYDGDQQGPGVDTPWPVSAMRQWTDAATVPGISGNVDGDTFYGDFSAFARYGLGGGSAPQPEPPAPAAPTPPAPTVPEFQPPAVEVQPLPAQNVAPTESTSVDAVPSSQPAKVDSLSPAPSPSPVNPSNSTASDGSFEELWIRKIVQEEIEPFLENEVKPSAAKAVVALGGAAVQLLTIVLGADSTLTTVVVALLTSLGVYSVSNK